MNPDRLPNGWKKEKLASVADVSLSNVDKKSSSDEKRVRLCNYLDVYKNRYITSKIDFMEATASDGEISKFKINPGDVLITKDSETPDDIAVSSVVIESIPNLVCGYHLALIRPNKKKVDSLYLMNLFDSNLIQSTVSRKANGLTRFSLSLKTITEIPVLVPPLSEQQKIADILTTVDEAIEKTDKVIAQTERVKKGLMQNFFVKGYAGAKPKFIEIHKLATVKRGASPRPIQDQKWFANNGVGWIRIEDVTKAVKYIRKTKQYLSKEGVKNSVLVMPGDLIMSICGTIGKPMILDMTACVHDGFVVFREISEAVDKDYFYYVLQHLEKTFSGKGQPGTQKNLNTTLVGKTKMPLPDKKIQEKIVGTLSNLDNQIYMGTQKKAQLEKLKKGLMQVLLTGKVRVKVS